MPFELLKEKYTCPINTVEIGHGANAINIGGETAMPFLFREGDMPHKPVCILEITDCEPVDWASELKACYGGALKDPVNWAKKCVNEFGSTALCVRLLSPHEDWGSASIESAVKRLEAVSLAVDVPLIVVGTGDDEIDNRLLPMASVAMKGRNCLFGIATQANYKTLAATCLADGHSIIADSPIDVNIAKQLNILITDMGFDPGRIVMHPTTTSLGYGMEYVYSIMERARLAAFIGDRSLAMPFILFVGQETWKVKEAKEFGEEQGVNWEIATSSAMIQAGVDLIVLRHPHSQKILTGHIEELMKK
jgi:acetyl-CoA decarbonylase/synthase complex subunit delta